MSDEKKDMHDVQTDYLQDGDSVIRKSSQYIPDSYLRSLRAERDNSMAQREDNFMRVASIPVAVVEKWKREGFDIYQVDGKEILKKLREEQLDAFITTNKSI
jgi:hypothetical protein